MKHVIRQFVRRICLGLFNFFYVSGSLQRHRLWLLRGVGVALGSRVQLNEELYFLNGCNLVIGEGSNLGAFLRIWDYASVSFGCDVMVSNNVCVIAGTHNTDDYSYVSGPVVIEDGCWIGASVTIIGPCRIGRGTIVGAGALVLGDLPSYSICGGVPAKVLKARSVST